MTRLLSCALEINGALFFARARLIQISLRLADCHFPPARVCSSRLLSQQPTMTQLELFAELKMGQLPFLNDTSLSHCIWLTCLQPGNGEEEEGSCGGMIWYELKLFPNRLHRVWSCPLLVWWILSPSINPRRACITLHQLPPPCPFLLRSKIYCKQ